MSGVLRRWLERASPVQFSAYCIVAAFGTYFCMYAFRKPFTAATFEGTVAGGLALKTLFVAAQVSGYTVSKFIGIRVVSEMPAHRRAGAILALIALAELSLLFFAVTPAPWNAVWLFANGLPLGMIFGLVLAFLEGRRQTEALTAGLCASFILSSGVVKSVGQTLIVDHRVGEFWMPAVTGLVFTLPLILFVGLLAQIPPPRPGDVEHRSERPVMVAADRRRFFRRHAVGLVGLVGVYLLLTVARSIRDDFAVEIWRDLGRTGEPSVFARTELVVMFGVLLVSGLTVWIRANRTAFLGALGLSMAGFALLAVASGLQLMGGIAPFPLMILSGMGLYVPYVLFHTTVFERLIATTRDRANIGYLMYLADAIGYLGYVGVMIVRNVFSDTDRFLELYLTINIVVAGLASIAVVVIARYFAAKMGDPSPDAVEAAGQ